ncbi:LPS export ABC transporter permease LptG [Chthonobacter rhizosphaerae]|uniref:LPS export ABC transporter permease LptG n=1 Tax=Chthonobacter rhizosphaerae TaxID=2735553 RepID=UPI001FE78802|nr:LPS export ABC transporter permease LptG [Chthonobacter rhizosphaerae]
MVGTLGLYYARLFLKWIVGLFLGAGFLAFLIDILEVIRANGDNENFTLLGALGVSALRIPLITEQLLPFAVLIGSIAAFLNLSRRSELIVSRAAGLSVWQFAMPGLVVALAIGVFATLVYNPAATAMKIQSDRIAAGFGSVASILSDTASDTWLRQRTEEGEAVMRVEGIADAGRMILEPTFWLFDTEGRLIRRVEAVVGELVDDHWLLSAAISTDISGQPESLPDLRLPTSLTADQVRDRLSAPEAVSFWRLPETIEQAAAAGLPPYRFNLQFHVLLARPLLLASMVLIAATVSLGLSRSGGVGRMILGGVSSGFVLYVVTEIARDLGSEGLVPAALAAWAPAVVASLLGSTVLLHREDG